MSSNSCPFCNSEIPLFKKCDCIYSFQRLLYSVNFTNDEIYVYIVKSTKDTHYYRNNEIIFSSTFISFEHCLNISNKLNKLLILS